MKPFENRKEAARLLAAKFEGQELDNFYILALPSGGVPIAEEMSKKLQIPWDVLPVKRIPAPNHPDYALGAMLEDEKPTWNEDHLTFFNIPDGTLSDLAEAARQSLLEQNKRWKRKGASFPAKGKSIILVDDGLGTGTNMQAAVNFLKRQGAQSISVVVPVASRSAKNALKEIADDMVVLHTP